MMTINRDSFEALKTQLFDSRLPNEHFFIGLAAEKTQFVRINAGKIRQIGTVEEGTFDVTLVLEEPKGVLRRASRSSTITGNFESDWNQISTLLAVLRHEVPQLSPDPYAQLPKSGTSSQKQFTGQLLTPEEAPDILISQLDGLDLAGIYASGSVCRAMAHSAGLSHWFGTETFTLDYSLYTPEQRAIKGTFAGSQWDTHAFAQNLASKRSHLEALRGASKKLARGNYRTYLAPAAVADLVKMFSWGTIGEASIRQGDSSLRFMRAENRRFSPLFNLSEDFSNGMVPRFNEEGELAPEVLPLIQNGVLSNTLVSSRSAIEYQMTSNGASTQEGQRCASLGAGSLKNDTICEQLGTGLYLSNLHYLNWSDQSGGRITGMTRYACFWVENGKIVAPIENMRWDDSLFSLFGQSLIGFTQDLVFNPDVMTYERRALGGINTPGALLSSMSFTL